MYHVWLDVNGGEYTVELATFDSFTMARLWVSALTCFEPVHITRYNERAYL